MKGGGVQKEREERKWKKIGKKGGRVKQKKGGKGGGVKKK